MAVKEALVEIVGAKYISDKLQARELYSRDYSVSFPILPNYVVQPKDKDEVQKIVSLANQTHTPIIPLSSGIHFNGNTIPTQGGIALDLRRMNRILDINERNRTARIEPGVTWLQLQDELQKHNLMALNPLLPHPQKSALTSLLEREPMLIPKFEYGDPILNLEMTLPSGEFFRTGSSCVTNFPDSAADGVNPQGPGIDWVKLVQGAQGTIGIVNWAIVKAEIKPKLSKTFFIPFKDIKDAIEPILRIEHRMIGQECLLINNFNLAAILADNWNEDFPALRKILPPWTLILVLAGGWRRPQERIEYEEEALRGIAAELSIPSLSTSLSGLPGVEREIPEMLRNPWSEEKAYWKFGYKGSCQDIFFHTVMGRIPEFTKAIREVAGRHGYSENEIGFYVQPLERARACHYECNFYYDPTDTKDVNRIRNLLVETAKVLIDMGAFFTRPYGPIADIVYDKATSYTLALKKVKKWLDPNNILSPGRLCF